MEKAEFNVFLFKWNLVELNLTGIVVWPHSRSPILFSSPSLDSFQLFCIVSLSSRIHSLTVSILIIVALNLINKNSLLITCRASLAVSWNRFTPDRMNQNRRVISVTSYQKSNELNQINPNNGLYGIYMTILTWTRVRASWSADCGQAAWARVRDSGSPWSVRGEDA